MGTRLYSVVFDALDMAAQGQWWADALGWQVVFQDDDEVAVADGDDHSLALVFVRVEEPKVGKNRVHLDLASQSLEDQAAIVARLVAAGSTRVDIGQGDVDWVVLADPEGNEFCVLAPNEKFLDAGPLAAIAVDSQDPATLAPFWAAAIGWDVEWPDELGDITVRNPARPAPYLDILGVPEAKTVKNRVHLDVAGWADDDQAAEVARLVALGASPADVGQGPDVRWVVLADPEGNEFCVLTSRDD